MSKILSSRESRVAVNCFFLYVLKYLNLFDKKSLLETRDSIKLFKKRTLYEFHGRSICRDENFLNKKMHPEKTWDRRILSQKMGEKNSSQKNLRQEKTIKIPAQKLELKNSIPKKIWYRKILSQKFKKEKSIKKSIPNLCDFFDKNCYVHIVGIFLGKLNKHLGFKTKFIHLIIFLHTH